MASPPSRLSVSEGWAKSIHRERGRLGSVGGFGSTSEAVIGAAIEVHRELGPGLLESAYESCLAYELHLRGLSVERQKVLPIEYKSLLVEQGSNRPSGGERSSGRTQIGRAAHSDSRVTVDLVPAPIPLSDRTADQLQCSNPETRNSAPYARASRGASRAPQPPALPVTLFDAFRGRRGGCGFGRSARRFRKVCG